MTKRFEKMAGKVTGLVTAKRMSVEVFMVVTAVAVGLMCLFTPYVGDDLVYLQAYKPFKEGMEPLSWDMVAEGLSYQYNWVARVANLSVTLTLVLLPKWLMNLCSALMWIGVMHYGLKFAGVSNRTLKLIFISMLMLLLPWYAEIFEADTAVNYVWASAMNMWFLYMFFNEHKTSRLGLVLLFVGAFLTGGMHEGASLPLICGLGIYFLPRLSKVTKRQWVMTVAYILGICLIFTSPGIWDRHELLEQTPFSIKQLLVALFVYQPITTILILVVGVTAFKSAHRKILCQLARSPWIALIIATVVGTAIQLHVSGGARSGWYPQLFAALALILYLNKIIIPGRIMRVVAWGLALFTTIHLIVAVVWTKRMGDDFRHITEAFCESADGVVVSDFATDGDLPMLAVGKPLPFLLHTQLSLMAFNDYYGDESKQLTLVPKELYDGDLIQAETIAGDAGVKRLGGYLFVDSSEFDPTKDELIFTYSIFGKMPGNLIAMPFTHPSGARIVYISPTKKRYQRMLSGLRRIDRVK